MSFATLPFSLPLSIGKRSNLAKKETEKKLKIVYKEYLTLHCEKYGFFKVDI